VKRKKAEKLDSAAVNISIEISGQEKQKLLEPLCP